MVAPQVVEYNEARAKHWKLLALLAEKEWWVKHHPDLPSYLRSNEYKARKREIAKNCWFEGGKYLTTGLDNTISLHRQSNARSLQTHQSQ